MNQKSYSIHIYQESKVKWPEITELLSFACDTTVGILHGKKMCRTDMTLHCLLAT